MALTICSHLLYVFLVFSDLIILKLTSDICCKSQETYEYEVQRLHDDINKKKENANVHVEIINRLRATLGTPQFKEIVKRK